MESRAIGKVYLVRLYFAAFTVISVAIIFIASATSTFPVPYMYQPTHIDEETWDSRFQMNTFKMVSLPLLLGAMFNLYIWPTTRLDIVEVDGLYFLKWSKEARQRRGRTLLVANPKLYPSQHQCDSKLTQPRSSFPIDRFWRGGTVFSRA